MLNELTLSQIGMRLVAMVVVAAVHGFAVAGVAVLLGDRGPRYDGKLTPVPSAHLSVIGTVAGIVFGMGWIKPFPIDRDELRSGRLGLLAIVLAGAISLVAAALVLLALVIPALQYLPFTTSISTVAALREAAQVCLATALLNLLPMPPLTGAHLFQIIWPRLPEQAVWIGTGFLLLLMTTGIIQAILDPIDAVVAPVVLGRALSGG